MLDAFISYSTRNLDFVQSLADSLGHHDKKVWFDQKRDPLEGIPRGTKWWDEIQYGISQAANFLFVISPESVVSPYCNAEIAHALQHEKRIVTLLYCKNQSVQATLEAINIALDNIDPTLGIPEAVTADLDTLRSLARRNWLAINQIQFVVGRTTDPLDIVVQQVNDAIDLDIQWIRLWNDFRQAVQLWAENGKDDDFLWSEKRLSRVREIAKNRGQEFDNLQQEFALPEAERLLLELDNIDTTHDRRLNIGIRLSEIGDPRAGVGIKDGVPDIVWCAVSGDISEVVQVKSRMSTQRETDSVNRFQFKVADFYISKHLITVQQFQAFLDADDGFHNNRWWQDLPKDYQNKELETQYQRYNNFPRDSVTWYQAIAFANWLNYCLNGVSFFAINNNDVFIVGSNVEIRLPTEWEWQLAASSGNKDTIYPWGDWDNRRANTNVSRIGRSTAVGMYPHGKAQCEALDLAGNLREWCLNEEDTLKIELSNTSTKALRGGSFADSPDQATCEIRNSINPFSGSNKRGFRVVCAPLSNLNID